MNFTKLLMLKALKPVKESRTVVMLSSCEEAIPVIGMHWSI